MSKVTIGVDVGGSGIRAGRVGSDGSVRGKVLRTPLETTTRKGIVEQISRLVHALTKEGAVQAVGVGLPAFLSQPKGVVTLAPNLPDMNGWHAAEAIQEALSLPCVVENDADAAAFGESWAGAGRDRDPFIYLGMGTGLGGGIVLGGQVLRGARGMAAELGHLTVFAEGERCGCGAYGCVEAYASATGLLHGFRHQTAHLGDVQFGERYGRRSGISAADVAAFALAGDGHARQVFETCGTALGIAIGQLIHVFNPSTIAIGGGVARAWDLFWPSVWEQVEQRTPEAMREGLGIVPAELMDDVGVIGAAGLAWQGLHPA